METTLSQDILKALKKFDTPTICNALERLDIRLRNEGYTNSSIVNRNVLSEPMVGYAITLQMRTANPPMRGKGFADNKDWWNYFLSLPAPRIAVIQDLDEPFGTGAVTGMSHGAVLKALGCIGIVTNGAVRSLPWLEDSGMHVYSGNITASHAYAHIIDIGLPVKIAGLAIKTGDLLHGDIHGIVSLQPYDCKKIIEKATQIIEGKARLVNFCQSKTFSLPGLKKTLEELQ